jgi:hypothetical protein
VNRLAIVEEQRRLARAAMKASANLDDAKAA